MYEHDVFIYDRWNVSSLPCAPLIQMAGGHAEDQIEDMKRSKLLEIYN